MDMLKALPGFYRSCPNMSMFEVVRDLTTMPMVKPPREED
jgi:hypothetical protein